MKCLKLLRALFAGVLLTASSAFVLRTVSAMEPETPSSFSGSIQIELPALSEPASQVHLGLYEAARLENGQFVFSAPFEQETLTWSDFEKSDAAGFLKSMAADLAGKAESAKSVPLQDGWCDENGRITFSGLEPGLYLLMALEAGTYGCITPELVVLPLADADGTLQTHLNLVPKVQALPALLVQKTDEQHQPIRDEFFSFAVFSDEEATELILELPADVPSGTVRIPLWQGELFLKELQAPAGYERSDEILKIETADSRSVSINGNPQEVKDGLVRLDFVNRKKKEPAAADSSSTAVSFLPLAVLCILFIAGTGLLLILHQKSET